MQFNYNNRVFRLVSTTGNGEVGATTLFHYYQQGNIVWGTYEGGTVRLGNFLALADENGCLDLRYQHINQQDELMTGFCKSTPTVLDDGRIRLDEKWQWTSGDRSEGVSAVEEIPIA